MLTEQQEFQTTKPINIQDDLLVGAMKTRYPFAADEIWKSGDLIFIQLEKSTWMVRILMEDVFSVTGFFDDGQRFSNDGMTQAELENVLDLVYFEENPKDDHVADGNEEEKNSIAEPETDFKALPSMWTNDEHLSPGVAQSQREGWTLMTEGMSSYALKHTIADLRDKLPLRNDKDVRLDEEGNILVTVDRMTFTLVPKNGQRFELFKGSKKLSSAASYAQVLSKIFDLVGVVTDEAVSGNMPVNVEEGIFRKPSASSPPVVRREAVCEKDRPVYQPPSLKERFLASRVCSGKY